MMIKAYVAGRALPILRVYDTRCAASAAELAAVDARSLDGDESPRMIVRTSGHLEWSVDMTQETLFAELLEAPSGLPGPVLV